jgi:hypothetical protein
VPNTFRGTLLQAGGERVRKVLFPALGGAAIFIGLYLLSLHSYLLFHGFAEVFSITVAGGIFMVAWNSRQFLDRSYFLILGVSFLFVGLLDLLHMLAYRGMNVFPGGDGNLAIQLWISARLVQALSFAIAPVFLRRRAGAGAIFAVYLSVVSLLLGSIFYWPVFPVCYVDGAGLTPFKIAAEYVICGVLLYALGVHLEERSAFEPEVLRLVSASVLTTVGSELAFTLYVSVYGAANLVGHFLKMVACYLMYRAFVQVALAKPYHLLFLDLKRSETAIRESQERLVVINRDLQASLQQLSADETAARNIQFLLLPPRRMVCRGCEFQSSIHTSAFLSGDFVDYFPIGQDLTGFYIADVSGHGVSSAFITVLLKSTMAHLLESYQKGRDDLILHPGLVLASLNRYLVQQHLGKYLTMFYAILNTGEGQLAFSNAGQFPSPILADAQGARFLEQKALPVGLFPDVVYRTLEVPISPPFRIGLFSDGILELLPQPDLRSKQAFLLAQFGGEDVSLDTLEGALGVNGVDSPIDDLTVMLLRTPARI